MYWMAFDNYQSVFRAALVFNVSIKFRVSETSILIIGNPEQASNSMVLLMEQNAVQRN